MAASGLNVFVKAVLRLTALVCVVTQSMLFRHL